MTTGTRRVLEVEAHALTRRLHLAIRILYRGEVDIRRRPRHGLTQHDLA